MTQAHKIAGMIFVAAGISLAQPSQQYGQPQTTGRLQEGAVCGQDATGNPRTLGRAANRDMNGRAQYQWTCLSEMERAPRAGGQTVWGSFSNYAGQPAPSQPNVQPDYNAYPQSQTAPNFEQQYQQYQQYQQMMPPQQAYPVQAPAYNAPQMQNPTVYPNAAMPGAPQKRSKVGRAFQVLQQAGQQADQIRQLYYNR